MDVWALQINPTVGDLVGNKEKILNGLRTIDNYSSNIVVTPELAICGYAPCDYLLNDHFIASCLIHVEQIAKHVGNKTWLFIGLPVFNPSQGEKPLFNSCAICNDGRIVKIVHKTLLPTYDVFDEARYFEPAKNVEENIIHIKGKAFGITICEDIWNEGFESDPTIYRTRPVYELWKNRADIIINLSASPFISGKPLQRAKMVQNICTNYNLGMIYVNQVGANDSLVFDGRSMMVAPQSCYAVSNSFNANIAPAFEEGVYHLGLIDPTVRPTENPSHFNQSFQSNIKDIKDALVLGIRDYCAKLGFEKVVIGMSGGVDSAVTSALAVEALGPDNVLGISMPTEFNSFETRSDARKQAEKMGICFHEEPIDYKAMMLHIINSHSCLLKQDDNLSNVVQENVQARIRGMILMGITNSIPKSIVLSTGNKSELSMGYCSIYGDMCGGLNVLGDVYKTEVFDLAKIYEKWIPKSVCERAPSAELALGQKDEDSLPPYILLDRILRIIVDQDGNYGIEEANELTIMIEKIYKENPTLSFEMFLNEIEKKVSLNEYKRQQGAPCIKINRRTLTNGWRRPIVANVRIN